MTGRSMLRFSGRDYALHEYMGPGCPDMNRRPVRMGVRTEKPILSRSKPGCSSLFSAGSCVKFTI